MIYKTDGKYRIFYVGQMLFRFIEIALQFERDRLEVEEIKKYDPSCNK